MRAKGRKVQKARKMQAKVILRLEKPATTAEFKRILEFFETFLLTLFCFKSVDFGAEAIGVLRVPHIESTEHFVSKNYFRRSFLKSSNTPYL